MIGQSSTCGCPPPNSERGWRPQTMLRCDGAGHKRHATLQNKKVGGCPRSNRDRRKKRPGGGGNQKGLWTTPPPPCLPRDRRPLGPTRTPDRGPRAGMDCRALIVMGPPATHGPPSSGPGHPRGSPRGTARPSPARGHLRPGGDHGQVAWAFSQRSRSHRGARGIRLPNSSRPLREGGRARMMGKKKGNHGRLGSPARGGGGNQSTG